MSDLNRAVSHALDAASDPEADALGLLHYLKGRFGWSGTVMTRADAETEAGRELTDDEWAAVNDTKSWSDAGSVWNEDGITWETVREALHQAGVSGGEQAPQRFEVTYRVVATGGPTLSENRIVVTADSERDAASVAVNEVHDTDPYADPRADARVVVDDVEPLEDGEE